MFKKLKNLLFPMVRDISIELRLISSAQRTNELFCGCYNDPFLENGESMYWDEWSAFALDEHDNLYKIIWRFKNYKDGRLKDEKLNWYGQPYRVVKV